MEVAEAFLVLCDAEFESAGFEGFVAEVFEGGGDSEDVGAFPFFVGGLLVFGEVFVGVAGLVGDLLRGFGVVVAGELAAVYEGEWIRSCRVFMGEREAYR